MKFRKLLKIYRSLNNFLASHSRIAKFAMRMNNNVTSEIADMLSDKRPFLLTLDFVETFG